MTIRSIYVSASIAYIVLTRRVFLEDDALVGDGGH